MQFLTLSSQQKNCKRTEDGFEWAMPNLDLRCFTNFGISSINIDYINVVEVKHQHFFISTNLIDPNAWNPNGIVHVVSGKGDYSPSSRICEKWPLDIWKPRVILFNLSDEKIRIVKNFHVTLFFESSEHAIKTLVSLEFS